MPYALWASQCDLRDPGWQILGTEAAFFDRAPPLNEVFLVSSWFVRFQLFLFGFFSVFVSCLFFVSFAALLVALRMDPELRNGPRSFFTFQSRMLICYT